MYKAYDKNIHVIPFMKMKNHWPRIVCMDYGSRNPTAVYWLAVDEDENVFVYREYYEPERNITENGPEIKRRFEADRAAYRVDEDGNYIV